MIQQKKLNLNILFTILLLTPRNLINQDYLMENNSQVNQQFQLELNQATNLFKKNEKEIFLKAEKYFFEEKWKSAEIFFKKVIEINPENAYAHSYLGDIYFFLTQLDKAIYHYEVSMELRTQISSRENLFLKNKNTKNSFFIKEFFRISQIYYLKKEFHKSRDYCNRIIKEKPDFFQCFYYLAMISYYQDKNNNLAKQYFEIYKKGMEAYKITLESHQQKYIEEEIEKINKILNMIDNPIINNIDNVLKKELNPLELLPEKKEQKKNRTEEFKEIPLSKQKKEHPIWIEIQYFTLHDSNKAIQLLEDYKNSREMKTSEDYFYIHNLLCSIYIKNQKWWEAEKECQQALKYNYREETILNMALISRNLQKNNEFEFYIQKFLEKKPLDIQGNFLYGNYLFENQSFTDSLKFFSRILAIEPNHKESLYHLFLIYKELNQISLMKTISEKIQIYYPDNTNLLIELARGFLEKNQLEDSIEILLRIYKKTKDITVGLVLSGAFLQMDNQDKAFEVLSDLYLNYPENLNIVKTIILLLLKMEKYDSIKSIAKKFLESGASQEEKDLLLSLLPENLKNSLQQNQN